MLSVLQKLNGMLASTIQSEIDDDDEIPEIEIRSREQKSREIGNALQRVMEIDAEKNPLVFDRTNKKITCSRRKQHVTFELTLTVSRRGWYELTTRISKCPMSRKSAPLISEFWESYTKPKKIWFLTNDAIQDFEHFTDDLITTDLQAALYAAKMRRVMALINPKTQQIMKENNWVLRLIKEGTEIEGKATKHQNHSMGAFCRRV